MSDYEEHDMLIRDLLQKLPKASIPADLIAAIEAETIDKQPWWASDGFRLRWMPAFIGLATVAGALWLSKIQENAKRPMVIPIAAATPLRGPLVAHAFVPSIVSSDTEKGDSRDN